MTLLVSNKIVNKAQQSTSTRKYVSNITSNKLKKLVQTKWIYSILKKSDYINQGNDVHLQKYYTYIVLFSSRHTIKINNKTL